jgi:hypothetical protein
VGIIAYVSEAHIAFVFRVEMRSMNHVYVSFDPTDPREDRVEAHAHSGPIETVRNEILPKTALARAIKCNKEKPSVPKRSQRQVLRNYKDFCILGYDAVLQNVTKVSMEYTASVFRREMEDYFYI